MRLLLVNSEKVSFLGIDELAKVIPNDRKGKPLNYGQGEGQVEIDGTVWGFYVTENGLYSMQFEEGRLSWRSLNLLVESIAKKINESFNTNIEIEVVGPFTDRKDI